MEIMSQEYAQAVLKVAVAQICRTIGWHSTHASTMDLLIDVTQHFLREISRIMHRYCELYNRTEANLDDLALAYKEIGINLEELMEYVQFVDPIPLTLEVPRFPLPKESNLNFLKPGSREVLTRPVHIPEYMPPLMFETDEDGTERPANDDERRTPFGDAKSLLNSAAIAITTVAATLSLDARAITDGDGGGSSVAKGPVASIEEISSTGEGLEDVSNAPHAVVNEEVEIPMQTIEVKFSADGDEESVATVSKRPDVTVKEKPTQAEETAPAGSKTVITTEEGRPTREISSVIMTTSGFISPAREGKLPESRIPIIPEERPLQPPAPVVPAAPVLSATHMPMALPSGASVPGVPSLAGSASVSSAALLASAAGNYFPKPADVAAGAVGVPVVGGTSGNVGMGAPIDPTQSPLKPLGEKPAKKVKKKPVDREKKKAEKGTGNAARKAEKHAAGDKGTLVKPSTTVDAAIENVVKEEREFTSPLPPPDALAAGRVTDNVGLAGNPFLKPGALKPELNDAFKAMDGSVPGVGMVAPTVPGKPAKPAKVKAVKEKAVKKRKSAAPKPVPVPGEMLMDDPALLNRQLPMGNFLPFPAPKPKKVPKSSKKAASQRGPFDASDLPPPLIGPLGLGTSHVGNPSLVGPLSGNPMQMVKPGGSNQDQLLGMLPKTGTTAALSLPLKKPPTGPFKQEEHEAQHPASNNQMIDQAAQLNLLQKMHPSLEITASPSISSQEDQEKPLTPGRMIFDGKSAKPDMSTDRDVIVIDDDKSPPHVSTLPTSMTTPTNKKQRKQAAHTTTPPVAGVGMHGQTYGIGPPGGTYDGEFLPDDPVHYSPLSNVPKTPDIRLTSSSSSTPSWMTESPRMATPKKGPATGNLFADLSAKTLTECMGNRKPDVPMPADGGKKPKRPKQKPKADAKAAKLGEGSKKLDDANQAKFGNLPGAQNPFALYPGSMNPFAPDASVYSKFLNQSIQAVAGMRNPMPFGMFPLPSGPGLIPDNPLFPRLPPTYPGQLRPGFQLPPNPFVLPGMNSMNLLRMPALANRLPGMAGMGGPGGNQRDFLDEPLDPETKLAQTPLDLQKSTCNVAPLVPPSLFQSTTENLALSSGSNELLNLSVKSSASPGAGRDTTVTTQTVSSTKKETSTVSVSGAGSISSQSIFSTSSVVTNVKESPKPEPPVRETYKEDQVVILPAASFLPGASPPQRSSMLVVDVEDSDGSQSTAGGKSKDGSKRKQKEHKKDRKLKDGKIKKKKDKKDKSKSKDRDREQLKEVTAGTATSPGVMTMGMIGAEEALMEQLRKERKEKKEKRKEKMKKEKRKEKERMGTIGSGSSPGSGPAAGPSAAGAAPPSGEVVPKLMLKLGGSNATQSPRSGTPDKAYMEQLLLGAGPDPKRDGSPELARISALVTRPPKLKGPTGAAVGGKSKKDDAAKNVPLGSPLLAGTEPLKLQPGLDTDDTFGASKQLGKVNYTTSTVGTGASNALVHYPTADDGSAAGVSGTNSTTTSRGSKVPRMADSTEPMVGKPFAGGETSKKPAKESKGSKSVHHHHHAAPDAYTTPVHMTDVDGNTVWICPACGRVDDGTPMIGCDGCDAWYHWVCVGILVPPDDNEDWYCRVCIAKKQDPAADEKQRKRKKKDKKTSKD
uniref:PHD-type domain-containing protein n=1 Tax=Anopheles culicifacies TaxID=139723 RepID=A0A182LXE1_9DIPT